MEVSRIANLVAAQILILPMNNARLRLEMTQPRWWEWTLIAEGTAITLGADVLDRIAGRVLERLAAGGESTGVVDGHHVRWVFSLAEKHHSLYCAADGSGRLLYFQDADARIVWRDRLSADHRRLWTIALDSIGTGLT